jgi:glycosyltransferase involved in cell wall biosynthesis
MIEGKPKVSVVIPTYNRSFLLEKAIVSVLEQTFTNYEIIVVDDGSSDNTRQVIDKFAGRVRYYYQENGGPSSARNRGIQAAMGEYIAFLDSDDVFFPEKLETQARALDENQEYGMVFSHAVTMDEEGHPAGSSWKGVMSGWIYPRNLFIKNCMIATPSVMVRASVFERVGVFDESLSLCEDLDLWRRIARRYPVLQICRPLVKVRMSRSLLREGINVKKFLDGRERFYEKSFREDPSLEERLKKELFSEMYCTYGILALKQKKIRYSALLIFKGMLYGPRSGKHLIGAAIRSFARKLRK